MTEAVRVGIAEEPARALQADSRFRKLIENSAIATTLVSPEGRFVVVNPAMCELLGYAAADLTNKTWSDVTAPEYVTASAQAVHDILAGRADSHRITKQYIHADGHRLWGEITLSASGIVTAM